MTNDQAPMTKKAPSSNDQRRRCCIGRWGFQRVCFLLAAALACTLLSACVDKNAPRPETAGQRQDRALRDPFAYGPDGDMPDPAAGRDAQTFDREGFKRDMDRFWNP